MQLAPTLTGMPGLQSLASLTGVSTPRATPPVLGTASASTAAPGEAQLAAHMLGGIGAAQHRALEGQQLIGAVSALFSARMSQIGSQLWASLRGTSAESQVATA